MHTLQALFEGSSDAALVANLRLLLEGSPEDCELSFAFPSAPPTDHPSCPKVLQHTLPYGTTPTSHRVPFGLRRGKAGITGRLRVTLRHALKCSTAAGYGECPRRRGASTLAYDDRRGPGDRTSARSCPLACYYGCLAGPRGGRRAATGPWRSHGLSCATSNDGRRSSRRTCLRNALRCRQGCSGRYRLCPQEADVSPRAEPSQEAS